MVWSWVAVMCQAHFSVQLIMPKVTQFEYKSQSVHFLWIFWIWMAKLGFFCFMLSHTESYLVLYCLYQCRNTLQRYWIDLRITSSCAFKKSNSIIVSSLNSLLRMRSNLPSFYEKMVKLARYLSEEESLQKFLRMKSGYSLNSMKKFWLALILLNSQSLHSNTKLKYISVSLVSSILMFLGNSCSYSTITFTFSSSGYLRVWIDSGFSWMRIKKECSFEYMIWLFSPIAGSRSYELPYTCSSYIMDRQRFFYILLTIKQSLNYSII